MVFFGKSVLPADREVRWNWWHSQEHKFMLCMNPKERVSQKSKA